VTQIRVWAALLLTHVGQDRAVAGHHASASE